MVKLNKMYMMIRYTKTGLFLEQFENDGTFLKIFCIIKILVSLIFIMNESKVSFVNCLKGKVHFKTFFADSDVEYVVMT